MIPLFTQTVRKRLKFHAQRRMTTSSDRLDTTSRVGSTGLSAKTSNGRYTAERTTYSRQ